MAYASKHTARSGGARAAYEQYLPRDVQDLVRATSRSVKALGHAHDMNRSHPSTFASSSADERISSSRGSDRDAFEVDSVDEGRRWHHRPSDGAARGRQEVRQASANTSRDAFARPPTAPVQQQGLSSSFSSDIGRKWGPAFEQITRNIITPRAGSPTAQQHQQVVLDQNTDPVAAVDAKLAKERDDAVLKSASSELARLKVDMKEAELRHEEALHELRMKHARELNTVRDEVLAARQQAASDATERMLATFSVKQQMLLSEIEEHKLLSKGVKARSDELEQKLFVMAADLQAANSRIQQLQRDVEEKTRHLEVAQVDSNTLRKDLDRAEELVRSRDAELRGYRQREVAAVQTERSLLARAEQLEQRVRANEADATARLRLIEEEFLGSNQLYQQLLTEASGRIDKYERLKLKYRDARALHAAQEQANADLTAQLSAERRRAETAAAEMTSELARLSSLVSQKEHDGRDERSKLHQRIAELEKELREARSAAEDRIASLGADVSSLGSQLHKAQQAHAAASHTGSLLEEQLGVARQQLLASEAEADARVRECSELVESTRAQSLETINALKRQLADKDKKLEQLVAASGDAQKWRRQLDEERGRRAALEEHLVTFRQKAKEAEEAAMLEVRKEQLRQSTAHALASATARAQQPPASIASNSSGRVPAEPKAPQPLAAAGADHSTGPRPPPRSAHRLPSPADEPPTPEQRPAPAPESSITMGTEPSGGSAGDRDRMQTFHATAQDVHHRIAESREEFLAKCATIVRSLRYRGGTSAGPNDVNSSDSD
jgi:hypothetical protein